MQRKNGLCVLILRRGRRGSGRLLSSGRAGRVCRGGTRGVLHFLRKGEGTRRSAISLRRAGFF